VSSTALAGLRRRVASRAAPVAFAFAGALVVFNLIAYAFGESPRATVASAFAGTWGTAYGLGQVLFKATPLLCTGLAFHVALRAGLFNIGSEGQLALASLLAASAGTLLPAATPAPVALALVGGVAVASGAAWAALPGLMRARLGVHEIISGIMLNRCVDVLLPWALVAGVGVTGLRTADLPSGARLPGLERWLSPFAGSAVSVAFPLVVAVVVVVYRWLERSRAGREMRWVGLGPEACEAQGVDVARRRVQAMLLSGALAALGVTGTVLGHKGYYELGLGAGAGLSGIAVAMVGRSGPVALVAAALVFGTLAQAGLAINARVPKEAMGVLEATVIVLVAVAAARPPGRRERAAVGPDREAAT
jgi:simple sugar transport system permease protein